MVVSHPQISIIIASFRLEVRWDCNFHHYGTSLWCIKYYRRNWLIRVNSLLSLFVQIFLVSHSEISIIIASLRLEASWDYKFPSLWPITVIYQLLPQELVWSVSTVCLVLFVQIFWVSHSEISIIIASLRLEASWDYNFHHYGPSLWYIKYSGTSVIRMPIFRNYRIFWRQLMVGAFFTIIYCKNTTDFSNFNFSKKSIFWIDSSVPIKEIPVKIPC